MVGNALESWRHERAAVYLYKVMAEVEKGRAAELFTQLGGESAKQAALWEDGLKRERTPPPEWHPGARERLVAFLVRRLGPRRMLPVLAAMKVRGLSIYRADGLAAMAAEVPSAPEESWHRAARGGGALRAAVFGINDGLLSNASLIVGVAGAHPQPAVIVLAGVAGLLAGGSSMAAGEYVSVATQRELLEHQLDLERAELANAPEEEVQELTLIYRAKGLSAEESEALARRMVADPVRGLDALAREELGLDPHGLASPYAAAGASFVSFSAGALIPLVPYLVSSGPHAFTATLVVTALSLLSVGGIMSLFTGRRLVWSALRMALLGAAAVAATWLIGRVLGVAVS